MSSITVRNVVGANAFAVPTTENEVAAATSALESILSAIPWLYYDKAQVLTVNQQSIALPEVVFIINTFFFNGSIIPSPNSLRASLSSAILANPDISSIGDINIDDWRPGDMFYQQWPEVEWIDSTACTVQFKDQVPAGAQIELGKYSGHRTGTHASGTVTYPPHIGKRFRNAKTLAVGQLNANIAAWVTPQGLRRSIVRARYFWPAPPGTLDPAPVIFGPEAPYGLVTGSRWDRNYNVLLLMEAGPSSYKV